MRGGATNGRVRYTDDFVIMVVGTKAHADGLWDEVAQVIAPLGLRLSIEKSRVCHMDEGFDFLGFRIQRRRRKGTNKYSVYTYPYPLKKGSPVFRHCQGTGAAEEGPASWPR